MVRSLCDLPPYNDFKISPQPICPSKSHEYDNYDKKTDKVPPYYQVTQTNQAIHYLTANFGPLSRVSITHPMLITAFNAYLTPRSPGTVGLVHKYINLKQSNSQHIKEKVTLHILKRRQALHEIPNPRSIGYRRCFSNLIPYLWRKSFK